MLPPGRAGWTPVRNPPRTTVRLLLHSAFDRFDSGSRSRGRGADHAGLDTFADDVLAVDRGGDGATDTAADGASDDRADDAVEGRRGDRAGDTADQCPDERPTGRV